MLPMFATLLAASFLKCSDKRIVIFCSDKDTGYPSSSSIKKEGSTCSALCTDKFELPMLERPTASWLPPNHSKDQKL